MQVSENATWSGCFYFRIIQAALAAVGAPENLVDIITGYDVSDVCTDNGHVLFNFLRNRFS